MEIKVYNKKLYDQCINLEKEIASILNKMEQGEDSITKLKSMYKSFLAKAVRYNDSFILEAYKNDNIK